MKFLITIMSFFALFFSFFLIINGGAFNQASSLGILTATVSINPLEVRVSAPDEVKIERTFIVKAEVENQGKAPIEDTEVEIYLSSGLELIRKDAKQELGVIPGHRKKSAFWQVKGEEIGTHIILVKARGEINDQEIEAEASRAVEIVKEKSPWWQRLFWWLSID